jgi:hypothetical protein
MAKYRVLRGSHRISGKGKSREGGYSVRIGETIESNEDLAAKYGRDKFLRIEDAAPAAKIETAAASSAPVIDGLDKLQIAELRKIAEGAQIPFDRNISRDALLILVRKAGVAA